MRRILAYSLIVTVSWAQSLHAEGNSWNKIRYTGGTIQAKVNPYDWNTTLTVTSDAIVLAFARGQTVRIKPAQVTVLSYGQEAHRRVADMVALSMLVTPLALFGLLHKSKDHLVSVEWRGDDGKPAAVLLEVHKDQYRSLLGALKTVTGKPVANAP